MDQDQGQVSRFSMTELMTSLTKPTPVMAKASCWRTIGA